MPSGGETTRNKLEFAAVVAPARRTAGTDSPTQAPQFVPADPHQHIPPLSAICAAS